VIAIKAVWISALLHGVSAAPGPAWYAKRVSGSGSVASSSVVSGSIASSSVILKTDKS
jgi:hypothetical protein